MAPKNIIIDIRPLMGGKLSGVEIYIINLLAELFKLDKINNYFLFANALKDQRKFFPKFNKKNVTVIQTRIPNKLLNLSIFLFNWPKIDWLINKKIKSKNNYDLYFEPDLRPNSLDQKIKIISVVHDLSFHHFPEFFSFKTRLWHKFLRPQKKLKAATKIIAVSSFTKFDLIKTYNIDEKKISVIYEGVNENFKKKNNSQEITHIKAKYQLPENYLLFLSTLEPRKNMQRLIEAFKKYKLKHPDNLKLVMAGKENSKIFAKLKLEKNPDIIFCGFIDEADKSTVFQLAKAFIYPSIFEGFGLPLLEAMASSTPIISSNTSSMPEILKDSALLIDPTSIEAITEAIYQIQSSELVKKLKVKMSENIKHFSWEKCARQTLELFT